MVQLQNRICASLMHAWSCCKWSLKLRFPREMTEKEYQAKRKVFMDCCRHYRNQVERRDRILMEQAGTSHYRSHTDIDYELENIELHMLEDNIQFVDRIFTRINKKCGQNARDTVYRIYVKAEKAEAIAAEQFVSKRTLLRSLNRWIESCL